jgi:hypothetical protein
VITLYKGNVLGWFFSGHAESVHLILVRGVVGLLKAIDVRYSDGRIYGYADCNRIYRLDLVYGNATLVSEIDVPLNGSYSVGFEFDPSDDTFARLVGNGNKNYLVNVDTGEVIRRTPLRYAVNDTNFRTSPMVRDAGFSFTEETQSRLFVIDAAKNGTLSYLSDPDNGRLTTVGTLGNGNLPLGRRIGFDIAQFDRNGTASEIALMVSVNRYWTVDLSDGSVARIWRRSLLRKIPYNAWGLAIVAPQFLNTAFGDLTANYVTTLYEVGGPYGNCTPCGTCPWDDRVVIIPGEGDSPGGLDVSDAHTGSGSVPDGDGDGGDDVESPDGGDDVDGGDAGGDTDGGDTSVPDSGGSV